MNKLAILLCFLLVFNFSKSDEDYDFVEILTYIFKGMSPNEEGKCAKVFMNHKSEIKDILTKLFNDIKDGKDFSSLTLNYGLKLIAIDGLATECKVFPLLEAINKLMSPSGIKSIGEAISNNADEIYEHFKSLKKDKGVLKKMVPIGKVLSIILNFSVN